MLGPTLARSFRFKLRKCATTFAIVRTWVQHAAPLLREPKTHPPKPRVGHPQEKQSRCIGGSGLRLGSGQACATGPNKNLTKFSGLFTVGEFNLPILRRGMPHFWRRNDVAHGIYCVLRAGAGFSDLRAASVDVWGQAASDAEEISGAAGGDGFGQAAAVCGPDGKAGAGHAGEIAESASADGGGGVGTAKLEN
jgi:hypothetical protein